MSVLLFKYLETPIGTLVVGTQAQELSLLEFVDSPITLSGQEDANNYFLQSVEKQLQEYFIGDRKSFDVPLQYHGTTFQIACWKALEQIPYGKTVSYSDQAHVIGNYRAVRAVANANRQNNIAIIIPCHRVIGKDGTLTGYGGGLWRKKWLLEHESKHFYEHRSS